MRCTTAMAAAAVLVGFGSVSVGAQTQGAPNPTGASGAAGPAQGCTGRLAQLRTQMERDGYWVSGYRGAGAPPAVAGPGPQRIEPGARPPQAGSPTAEAPGTLGSPWAGVAWDVSPSGDIRVLYGAAATLARRGNESACSQVVAELGAIYADYVDRLTEAGIEPGEVVGWRQEQILAARPVTELDRAAVLDNFTGTDVRNLRDEYLGSIDDLVFDPESGRIAYALVSRGGFLGIGGEKIAVPWSMLRATLDFNTFVLPVDAAAVEGAPGIDPRALASADEGDGVRRRVDTYWQQAAR